MQTDSVKATSCPAKNQKGGTHILAGSARHVEGNSKVIKVTAASSAVTGSEASSLHLPRVKTSHPPNEAREMSKDSSVFRHASGSGSDDKEGNLAATPAKGTRMIESGDDSKVSDWGDRGVGSQKCASSSMQQLQKEQLLRQHVGGEDSPSSPHSPYSPMSQVSTPKGVLDGWSKPAPMSSTKK